MSAEMRAAYEALRQQVEQNPPEIDTRTAVEMGWLRRIELGDTEIDVWEQPDGGLLAVAKGIMPTVQVLRRAA